MANFMKINIRALELVHGNGTMKTELWIQKVILNVITCLSKMVKKDDEFQIAYENAKRDSEWLLMPLDPMRDGIGYQSRIAVADFWNIEYFKYLN